VFLYLGRTTSAQTQATPSSQTLTFVQAFYDWYLPFVLDDNLRVMRYTIAITRRPELFDPPLLRALRNDAAAQAKTTGTIDGLDFDPFVDTNGEPQRHFRAVRVSGSLVAVVGFDDQISKPLVTLAVEVRCKQEHCVIVNVHYPARDGLRKSDLLSILRLLHPRPQGAK
jgi:hypothetical protein